MGELIKLSDYRNKKRVRSQEKISNFDLSKPPKKKVLPRIKLPALGEVFVRNLHLRVSDPYALDIVVVDLFADPVLSTLFSAEDDVLAINVDYKLQTLRSDRKLYPQSLLYARLHMEKVLGFSLNRLEAVKAHPKQDQLARSLLGMFSIAWQLYNERELVSDPDTLAKYHAKK